MLRFCTALLLSRQLLGGSGKSELARMLYNELVASFKDTVRAAFVALDKGCSASRTYVGNHRQLVNSLLCMLHQLQPDASAGTREQWQVMDRLELHAAVDKIAEGKLLLILDGLSTKNQLDYVLPHSLVCGSRLLITSRVPSIPGSNAFQVSVLALVSGITSLTLPRRHG